MITLKTLHLATAQEVFDQVKTHLLTQMEKSVGNNSCRYRSYSGLKCAAGCLIADDEYTEEMEDKGWYTLIENEMVPLYYGVLINDLQKVHDLYYSNNWKEELEKVSKKYNLEWHE